MPIAFAVTVPAEAVTSRLDWQTFVLAAVFAVVALRVHALVLALRLAALHGRLGVADELAGEPIEPGSSTAAAESFAMAIGWTLAPVYFVQEVGMDPLQLVLTGTFMEIAYFLFEVPTGVVADSYSRRTSVIVAQVIMGISFVVTGLVTSVPLILAAAALMGFGWTFKSGAIDAWLADEVGPERLGREYQRGAQVARIFTLVGIGAAVGLALVDLSLPIVAGGLVLVALGGLLAFVMPESGFEPAAPEELSALRSMTHTAGRGGRLIRARPILLLVLGITFFSGMWSESVDRLWEAHFLTNIGVPGIRGLQLDHLVRDPECRRGRARDRHRATTFAPLRARELARHDVEPLLARCRHGGHHRCLRVRRELRCSRSRLLGDLRREVARRSRLLDLAQREHRGFERAGDRDLDDEPRRLGG